MIAPIWSSTLRALLAPRRLLPIVLVAMALTLAQLLYSRDPRAGLVPLGMTLGFVLVGPVGWRTHFALHLLGAALVVGLAGILLPRALHLGPTFLTDAGSLGVATVLYLAGGWGLGRDIELEQDLERSRLHAMRAHLDPHFLYNTLNAIAEWCRQDAAQAEEAIVRLSAMLQSVFAGLELRRWPLARELAVVADLVALHRVRDPGALTLAQRLEGPIDDVEVPPLVLLLLAENAVKHGAQKGHRGPLALAVTVDAAAVRVELANPGPYRPAGGGRGLALLRRQLEGAYGRGRARLVLDEDDGRTRARLTLPRSRPL